MSQSAAYSFSADPRAVAPRKKAKYRQENQYDELDAAPGNIMYDPRVVRGSTFAARVVPQEDQRASMRKKPRKRQAPRRSNNQRPSTPEAVDGRKHIDVQTDDYLEELTDRPPERDQETQTDVLMDRPPSPLFMPAKTGVDKDTQIEPGDLFDFDVEVEPILEVLVGKTMEQSMDEVLEEEELNNIRSHKARFEQQRNVELAEVQRLEAEAKRRAAEKERRLAQERLRVQQEEEVMEKVAARGFAKNFLSDLHNSVFEKLIESGHFYDPVAQEVEEQFMPWLHSAVQEELKNVGVAQQLIGDMLGDAMKKVGGKMEDAERRNKKVKEKKAAMQFLLDLAEKAKNSAGDDED